MKKEWHNYPAKIWEKMESQSESTLGILGGYFPTQKSGETMTKVKTTLNLCGDPDGLRVKVNGEQMRPIRPLPAFDSFGWPRKCPTL